MGKIPQAPKGSKIATLMLLTSLAATAGVVAGQEDDKTAATKAEEGQSDREEVVQERAQARWDALLEGDFESAYEFNSPGYRARVPYERFRDRIGVGVEWTDARATGAECETDRCRVTVDIGYRVLRGGMENTRPVRETWIRSNDSWWIQMR